MQIVIEIDKGLYERIKYLEPHKNDMLDTLMRAVQHGTPLPKGHGRLIDADKTILKICGSSCGCHLEECGRDEPCFSVARIASAPTIIEADEESEGEK